MYHVCDHGCLSVEHGQGYMVLCSLWAGVREYGLRHVYLA
jgi:hypothetical protein